MEGPPCRAVSKDEHDSCAHGNTRGALADLSVSTSTRDGYHDLSATCRFLFSMANAPELIPPSEWMPIVFNGQDARYETRIEAEGVTQAMMALYNNCARGRVKEK